MISASFNTSRDDTLAFTEQYYQTSPTVQSTMRRSQVLFLFMMLGFAAWTYWKDGGYSPIVFVISGVLWAVFYPSYFKNHIKKTAIKLLKESSHEKSFGNCTITLSEDGITSSSPIGDGRYKWDFVDRVTLTPDYLFVFLSGPIGYSIQRKQLEESKIQEIKSYIEEHIKKPL